MNNDKVASLEDLQKAASAALRHSLTAPDTERTDDLRKTAHDFVAAREHFFTREGEPDWLGRTYAYRTWVRETMGLANVPAEDVTSLQAAIRYHAGNLLRQRLPEETLADLGLRSESPRERSVEKRERTSNTLNLFGGGAAITTKAEILQAAALMEATLKRVNASGLPAKERREASAAIRRVADAADALAKVTK